MQIPKVKFTRDLTVVLPTELAAAAALGRAAAIAKTGIGSIGFGRLHLSSLDKEALLLAAAA